VRNLAQKGAVFSEEILPMVDLATLPEADRQDALERFLLIQPHLEGPFALTAIVGVTGIP